MRGSGSGLRAPAAAAMGAAGLVVAHGLPSVTAIGPLRRRWFPVLAGSGAPGHVALTFDDGPDPRSTPRFLEVLDAHRVTATFFLLGEMVARAPALAAEVAAAGHEIGVHGWTHRSMLLRTPGGARSDLRRGHDTIAAATGTAPVFYRPPNGVLSTGSILAARGLGLTPVLWTADGRDWTAHATPRSVRTAILAGLRRDGTGLTGGTGLAGGDTVLLHDSDCTSAPQAWRSALGALPGLLAECARAGLAVGPLRDHGGQFSLIARNDSRNDPIVANTAVGS
jgi:peptidoglycan-N-acetylglucosamine deacetylase